MKSLKSLEELVHSCATDKMFWKFQNIPRNISLQELRPATEVYYELRRTSKMKIFCEDNGFYTLAVFAKKLHCSCLTEL